MNRIVHSCTLYTQSAARKHTHTHRLVPLQIHALSLSWTLTFAQQLFQTSSTLHKLSILFPLYLNRYLFFFLTSQTKPSQSDRNSFSFLLPSPTLDPSKLISPSHYAAHSCLFPPKHTASSGLSYMRTNKLNKLS